MKDFFTKTFFPHDHKKEHFRALDGLRGIAVLLVLLSHSSNADWMFHETLNFQKSGKIGVYLFFVLSAYLLDRQIAIALLSQKANKQYWKNYLLRRFLRIYPLFIIALLIHGLLSFIGIPTVIDSIKDFLLHVVLLKGKSIFWSIPVEFKYYFLSPLIMWLCHRYLKWKINYVTIAILTLITAAIVIEYFVPLPTVSTIRYLPIFLVGTFISIFELLRKGEKLKTIPSTVYDIVGILGAIIIILSIPKIFKHPLDVHSARLYLPYALCWGGVLIAVKYGKHGLKKVMEWKVLRLFGTISYSAYLFHMVILKLLERTTAIPEGTKVYLFFIGTVILSMLSYVLIEKPLSRIRIYNKDLSENALRTKT